MPNSYRLVLRKPGDEELVGDQIPPKLQFLVSQESSIATISKQVFAKHPDALCIEVHKTTEALHARILPDETWELA
jgi:hypothetical protein